MMSDETLIEDLIDGYNGYLDSWEEPLVFRRAEKEINLLRGRIAELEQVLEIIADTSSSVDTRDIAEDALNRIRGNDD
jgi:hypothetical protein